MSLENAIAGDNNDDMQIVPHPELAVFDFGGHGPALIFCHATGFHGQVWRQVAAELSDSYHCYSLDFRGHGDSPRKPDQSMDWHEMADDLTSVVASITNEPVLAVGHSMGGACIALAELECPGTFKAAWLFEPILLPDLAAIQVPGRGNPLAEGARKRREVFDSREAVIERYSSRPPLDGFFPATLEDYVRHGFADNEDGTVILKCRGETEATVFEMTIPGSLQRVSALSLPVHVAHGDGGMPATLAPLVAENIPNAELEHFEGLSHFGPLENPSRVAGSIRSFFAKAQ